MLAQLPHRQSPRETQTPVPPAPRTAGRVHRDPRLKPDSDERGCRAWKNWSPGLLQGRPPREGCAQAPASSRPHVPPAGMRGGPWQRGRWSCALGRRSAVGGAAWRGGPRARRGLRGAWSPLGTGARPPPQDQVCRRASPGAADRAGPCGPPPVLRGGSIPAGTRPLHKQGGGAPAAGAVDIGAWARALPPT